MAIDVALACGAGDRAAGLQSLFRARLNAALLMPKRKGH